MGLDREDNDFGKHSLNGYISCCALLIELCAGMDLKDDVPSTWATFFFVDCTSKFPSADIPSSVLWNVIVVLVLCWDVHIPDNAGGTFPLQTNT